MKSILCIIVCCFSLSLFSQTTVSGTIKNKKGEPLIGASVMIEGTYDGGITNTDGQFSFTTKPKDTLLLIAKYIGYDPKRLTISVPEQLTGIHFILKEKFNELEAVTITAGAFEAGDRKKAVVLSSMDMVTTPGASGNVTNALQFLPGTTTNGESGKLFVRGGSSEESQTFIDGTLVHNPFNASAPNTSVRSRFNPFMFSGTVFSTGGFSAEYGGALSSVLLLETKGVQEQDQLDISILSVGLGLAGTKKWDNSAITASIDYTNLTPYMNIIPQDINWIKMPVSSESGLNFRQKTKNGLFKIYGNYSLSKFDLKDFNLNSQLEDVLKLDNTNIYLNSSYKGKLRDKWIMAFSGAFTDYVENVGINLNRFSQHTLGTHFKAKASRSFNKRIKLNTGLEAISTQYDQTYQTPTDTITSNFTNHNLAGFAEGNFYLSKKIVTRIGARFEHSTLLNRQYISPRLSAAYKLNKTSQFSFAYGTFKQNPNQDYLIYTDQLDFEQSEQYMINYTWSKNRRTIKTEVYYKKYNDLVKFDMDQSFYMPEYYTNAGNGHAYGLDFFFRDKKTIKNGDYWLSYSYLDTRRDYLNYPYSASPRFASKHNLSVVYKHWIQKWRTLFGASFNYSSPRSYNDPNLKTFNSEKMKAYQSLNLNASYLYRENVIFYASATNVLGYKQEFGYRFSDTPNNEGIYEKSLITPPADRFFIIACFITLSKSGDQNQLDKIN